MAKPTCTLTQYQSNGTLIGAISDFIALKIREGYDRTVNTASIEVPGTDLTNYSNNQIIKIELGYSGSESIAFYGYIENIPLRLGKQIKSVTLDLTSSAMKLLNKLIAKQYIDGTTTIKDESDADTTTMTASRIVWDVLKLVRGEYGTDRINSSYGSGQTGNIWATSAVITQPFIINYEPAFKAFIDLSSHEYTNDSNYMFYVDKTNIFHWQRKPETMDPVLTEGVDILEMKPFKAIQKLVNIYYIYLGTDLNGKAVMTAAYDAESVKNYGVKAQFKDMSGGKAKTIKTYHIEKGSSNTTFLNDIRTWGRAEGNRLLSQTATRETGTTILIKGTTEYNVGNQIKVVSSSFGGEWATPGVTLRIKEIEHSFDNSGWITGLNCVYDVL